MKRPISASQIRHLRPAPPSGPGVAARAPFDFSNLNIGDLKRGREKILARTDGHAPSITRVIPVSRAIALGGKRRVVDELRIGDLSRLQAWLEEQVPHPLDGMPPAWADPEPETRAARLATAWEAAGTWPVRFGSEAGSKLLGTREGRAYFLSLCRRRSDPSFGLADALALVDRITPAEWAGLRRVAYGLTPREEIADEVAGDRTDSRAANWLLSAHRAAEHPGGPSYLELAEWTIGQWRNFRNQGKAVEFTGDFAAQSRRARKALGLGDKHG